MLKPVIIKTTGINHVATGKAIRAYRNKHGIAGRTLAMALGVSQAYLSDLERGRRSWTEERFAEAVSAIEQLAVKNK